MQRRAKDNCQSQMVKTPVSGGSVLFRVNGEMHLITTQYHFPPIRLAKVIKIYNIKLWQRFGGEEIQSLWKLNGQYLKQYLGLESNTIAKVHFF